jgi:hypothetical protein
MQTPLLLLAPHPRIPPLRQIHHLPGKIAGPVTLPLICQKQKYQVVTFEDGMQMYVVDDCFLVL